MPPFKPSAKMAKLIDLMNGWPHISYNLYALNRICRKTGYVGWNNLGPEQMKLKFNRLEFRKDLLQHVWKSLDKKHGKKTYGIPCGFGFRGHEHYNMIQCMRSFSVAAGLVWIERDFCVINSICIFSHYDPWEFMDDKNKFINYRDPAFQKDLSKYLNEKELAYGHENYFEHIKFIECKPGYNFGTY